MKKIWVFLAAGILWCSVLFAQKMELNDIKSIPRFDTGNSRQKNDVGEYHGRGVIDAIDNNDIVVNDSLFTLSENLKILHSDGSQFSRKLLPGKEIYYYLDGPKLIGTIYINK